MTTFPLSAAKMPRWANSPELLSEDIHVPEGFAVTAQAYRDLLESNSLWDGMGEILETTDWSDMDAAARMSARLRKMVATAKLPAGLDAEIRQAYRQLSDAHGRNVAVAVRSSATAEDLPGASFAGQHETFLNIRGAEALVDAVRQCFASLFTQRAISYRMDKGFAHKDVALSVGHPADDPGGQGLLRGDFHAGYGKRQPGYCNDHRRLGAR